MEGRGQDKGRSRDPRKRSPARARRKAVIYADKISADEQKPAKSRDAEQGKKERNTKAQ